MLAIIQQNQALIRQAIDVVAAIETSLYGKCCEEIFDSSIGQHLRHCIEHYDELFMGIADKRAIRYHDRPRNLEVEVNPSEAANRLRFIFNQLERVDNQNVFLEVSDGGVADPAQSSLFRELEFLISHTIHHFALIKVIANRFQIEVPGDFGVAFSTLKHRDSN